MKRKIAFIVPSLRGGGAERVITNIVSNINQEKFEIILILIKKEGTFLSMIPDNIKIIDLNSQRVRYAILKLIKEININNPDIIMSTLGHMNLALLLIRRFIKTKAKIYVREASTPSKSLMEMPKIKRLLFKGLYTLLYPKADLVIAQCDEMKNDLIFNFRIKRSLIQTIYNPLDIENIRKKRDEFYPYRKDEVNILAVGRLTPAKGFDILIEAFKIVAKAIPTARLYILGDGELKSYLFKKSEELGVNDRISFLGFKKNPYPYYYYSDTYVLSSRWEGFPNTLLEALACDAKVVATKCKSGPKEIIKNDMFGNLVEVDNPVSLAEGIIKSINEENKSNGRAMDFSIKNIIKEYESLFLFD